MLVLFLPLCEIWTASGNKNLLHEKADKFRSNACVYVSYCIHTICGLYTILCNQIYVSIYCWPQNIAHNNPAKEKNLGRFMTPAKYENTKNGIISLFASDVCVATVFILRNLTISAVHILINIGLR